MTQGRWFIAIGAVSGAFAVAAGAFGAHGLAQVLDPEDLRIFRTGASYHLVHSVMVCLVGIWLDAKGQRALLAAAGWAFLAGILCFSGSLYLLALDGPRWLGPVTPIGGIGFLFGWLGLAGAALRR